MGSVTQKVRSQPHIFENGVEGKICGAGRKMNTGAPQCGKWHPLVEFPRNYAYEDGYAIICKHCKKLSRKVDAVEEQPIAQSQAPRPMREYNDAPFCDSTVKAVALVEDGITKHYLGLRAMCEVLGVDTQMQRQRIERSEVLFLGLRVVMMTTPSGQQEHYVLDSTLVPFWLATMDASRLRDDVRPKVVHFQRIAADVLARYFLGGDGAAQVAPNPEPPILPPTLEQIDPYRPLLDVFTSTGTQSQQLSRHFQDMDRLMQAIPAVHAALVKYTEQLEPLADAVKRRRNPLTHGWIYVFKDVMRRGRYKIGMTQDPDPAVRQSGVEGQWGKGQSERIIWIETDNVKLERAIHRFYKSRDRFTHLGDEFYRLSDDDIACLETIGPFLRFADFRDELLVHQTVIQGQF